MPQRPLLLLFCGAVLFFTLFFQLGYLAFLGADEPRYARVAEEMNLRSQYVTPTLEFRPWLEKPPLLFWMQAASFRWFGVSEGTARLPNALLALLGAWLTSWLAGRWSGSQSRYLTPLILTTSTLYFVYGRSGSTDLPLTVMLTAALVSAARAWESPQLRWGLLAGVALGLAVLAKGPVAILLFLGVCLASSFLSGEYRWTWKQTIGGMATFIAVAFPWFWWVWEENGYNFLATFFLNHHLARFISPLHHHSQPIWFFVVVLPLGFFPWTFFLISSWARLWSRRTQWNKTHEWRQLFLWVWALLPLIFFSLSSSKLPGYILPILPPLAILVAHEWSCLMKDDLLVHRYMKLQMALLLIFAGSLCVLLVVGFPIVYGALATGAVLAFPILTAVLIARLQLRRHRPAVGFTALTGGMALFVALAYWQAAPHIADYHSAKRLCLRAQSQISLQSPLIFYRYFHHTALYYTQYRALKEAHMNRKSLHQYFQDHPQDRYILLTQQPGWEDLKTTFAPRLIQRRGNLYLLEIRSYQAIEKRSEQRSPDPPFPAV